jgi:hypothetical protein
VLIRNADGDADGDDDADSDDCDEDDGDGDEDGDEDEDDTVTTTIRMATVMNSARPTVCPFGDGATALGVTQYATHCPARAVQLPG